MPSLRTASCRGRSRSPQFSAAARASTRPIRPRAPKTPHPNQRVNRLRSRGSRPRALAKASSSRLALRFPHFPGQAKQRALDSHARGIRRWLAEGGRQFIVAHPKFDPSDNRFTIFRAQSRECPFVELDGLAADSRFERRWSAIGGLVVMVECIVHRTPVDATNLAANPIQQGLAQIRLERPFAAHFEPV